MPVTGILKQAWIPLVLAVVGVAAGMGVNHLHGIFGSHDPNADYGGAIKIVEFNPKIVVYDITGPPGAVVDINYWDDEANTHEVSRAVLPWSLTLTTTLPSVGASIVAQGDADHLNCRITVDGEIREEQSTDGLNTQVYCLVKSA